MYCAKCKAENSNADAFCCNCGQALENNQVEAISDIPESDEKTIEKNQVENISCITESNEVETEDAQGEAVSNDKESDGVETDNNPDHSVTEESDLDSEIIMPDKKVSKKKFIIGIAACIGLVVMSIGLFCAMKGLSKNTDKYSLIYTKDNSLYSLLVDNNQKMLLSGKAKNLIENPSVRAVQYSNDGSVIASLENFNTTTSKGDISVRVNGNEKQTVAKDVFFYYAISKDGKHILYIQDVDMNNYSGTLYLYDVNKKTKEKISDKVLYALFSFSPDGKSILFSNVTAASGDGLPTSDLYLKIQGKDKEKIDSGAIIPLFLSNDGKSVIYGKTIDAAAGTGAFYDKEKGKEKVKFSDGMTAIYTNNDNSQFLFIDEKEKNFYVKKYGAEAEKIDTDVNFVVFPSLDYKKNNTNSMGQIINLKTVDLSKNILYIKGTENALYMKKGKSEKEQISLDCQMAEVSSDYSTIAYLSTDTLYTRNFKGGKYSEKVKVADKTASFILSTNGDYIYYLKANKDGGNDLLLKNKNAAPETIATKVLHNFIINKEGNYVMYIGNYDAEKNIGDLFVKNVGGTKFSIAKNVSSNFVSFDVVKNLERVYYIQDYVDGKGDLYFRDSKKDPVKIDTGVELIDYLKTDIN